MNPSGDVNESVCFDSAQSKSFCLSQSKPPQIPFRSLKVYRGWHHRGEIREFSAVIYEKMHLFFCMLNDFDTDFLSINFQTFS